MWDIPKQYCIKDEIDIYKYDFALLKIWQNLGRDLDNLP